MRSAARFLRVIAQPSHHNSLLWDQFIYGLLPFFLKKMASSTKKKGVSKDGAQGSSQTLAQTIGDVEDLHSAYVHHKKTLHNFTQEEIVEVRAKLLEVNYLQSISI